MYDQEWPFFFSLLVFISLPFEMLPQLALLLKLLRQVTLFFASSSSTFLKYTSTIVIPAEMSPSLELSFNLNVVASVGDSNMMHVTVINQSSRSSVHMEHLGIQLKEYKRHPQENFWGKKPNTFVLHVYKHHVMTYGLTWCQIKKTDLSSTISIAGIIVVMHFGAPVSSSQFSWSRKIAAHLGLGLLRVFCLLKRQFFLTSLEKCLLIRES